MANRLRGYGGPRIIDDMSATQMQERGASAPAR